MLPNRKPLSAHDIAEILGGENDIIAEMKLIEGVLGARA